ncbi:MAG: ABC transporter transmembrane domain-containing protein [Candidatus Cloacimonetes bacterium]|nr:ABC transporter transmembrane domain-containing protein [Candidatus Cloacimonadota bacterium]
MLKRFVAYYKNHKWLFVLDIGVAFLSAILSVFMPVLTRTLLKNYIPDRDFQAIIGILSLMLLIIMIKSVFSFIRIKWGHILGVRMEYDMRADIFRHLQKLSFNYYDNTKTGHIMSRITNDLNTIAEVAHHAPEDFIISFFIITASFIAMFNFSVPLSLISLVSLPLLLIWGMTFGLKMRGGFRLVRKKIAEMNSNVENSMQGIREVKSYANEELEIVKFDLVNQNFRTAKEKMYALMAKFHAGMQFLADFYHLSVIAGGVWLIYTGKIDVADLLAFTLFISYILDPINRLISFVEQFQQGGASFERFIEIMDIEPDIQDRKDAKKVDSFKGEIRIEHLNFKYSSSQNLVLKDVSLTAEIGKKIAIVGESGAGKSTLVALIPRFYEPSEGKILIDGFDIMNLNQKSLRENIGIVQQNIFMFDTSIKDNILYGRPSATDEEVFEAARKANLSDFIDSLPDKFETSIPEKYNYYELDKLILKESRIFFCSFVGTVYNAPLFPE